MKIENIKRRERRFYRKFKGNKIIYTNKPIKSIKNKNNKFIPKPKDIEVRRSVVKKVDNRDKRSIQKERIVNNTLKEMQSLISPDVDSIASMIYNQMKNNKINVDHSTVKKAVERSRHYRASRNHSPNNINIKNDSIVKTDLSNPNELKTLVEDVYDQLEKEQIKKENKDLKDLDNTDASNNNNIADSKEEDNDGEKVKDKKDDLKIKDNDDKEDSNKENLEEQENKEEDKKEDTEDIGDDLGLQF